MVAAPFWMTSPMKRPAACSVRSRSRSSLALTSSNSTVMPYFFSKLLMAARWNGAPRNEV